MRIIASEMDLSKLHDSTRSKLEKYKILESPKFTKQQALNDLSLLNHFNPKSYKGVFADTSFCFGSSHIII